MRRSCTTRLSTIRLPGRSRLNYPFCRCVSSVRQQTSTLPYLYRINLNPIDLVIVLALLIGLANGYRRGFWLSLTQYAGLVAGVVAGAALTPTVMDALKLPSSELKPLAAGLFLVICGSLGSTLGYWLGDPLRRTLRGPGLARPPEKLAGSMFSAVAVLSVAWYLGLTFSQNPDVGRLVQRSAALRSLDVLFPRPPGFLSGVSRILAGVPFPQTFASLDQPALEPPSPPASVDTPGIESATRAVYKVEGRGCGGVVSGSAYPVAPGYLITNAHVVSGTSNTHVSQDRGRGGIPANVVLFDAQRDVAILWAPQAPTQALPTANGEHGTQGAVIGYPGGGPEMVSAAVLEKTTTANGRDIYNDALVDRNIWILSADVKPGNSGGPVVDMQGRVLGIIFAASSTDPGQAYALTNTEIDGDVRAGVGRTGRMDTSAFHCAV